MARRSDVNNYRGRHVYMLTMAVEGRRPLLGQVVGDPSLPAGEVNAPHIILSPLGQEVMRCWGEIPKRHPEVQVLAFQMMPDHLHGILFVKEEMRQHLGQVICGFKAGCNKAYRRLILGEGKAEVQRARTEEMGAEAVPLPTPREEGEGHGKSPAVSPAASSPSASLLVDSSPSASSLAAGAPSLDIGSGTAAPVAPSPPTSPAVSPAASSPVVSSSAAGVPSLGVGSGTAAPVGAPLPLPSQQRLKPEDREHGLLFERGYNDLIAKGYDMLPRLIAYVHDNPRRLLLKRQRPEWLRPFFGLRLGGETYNGIGNLSLLLTKSRKAVRVSRRVTAEEADYEEATFLSAAKAGTVLISPSISPGEKRVMRAAFNAHFPTVVILPNGFTPFSKPHGEQFEACAAGRLLMLSPWPHHNEKLPLTRMQCHAMNVMAHCLSTLPVEEVQAAISSLTV